ncbi:MAG TPA: DUF4249 domain-containing protein [Chryseolinea sp.]|nr:DUF4249 domain-containing protein [Chryseolinea sp.]
MLKRLQYFVLFLIVAGCIEPYEFVIRNDEPTLVVEAHLSDKSFNETLNYPSDGRYFTVKLSYTGDVLNVRPIVIRHAVVELRSDQNETWQYTETEPGVYALLNDEFKAEQGSQYKLYIELPTEETFESEWESLPTTPAPSMGSIASKETEIKKYEVQAKEEVVVTAKVIKTEINLPENTTGKPIFYRWRFIPHWVYIAPLSPSVISPGHTCWATSPNYLLNYAIQQDNSGGYAKDLFSMETVRNERIFEKFSALVIQHSMTEAHYNFWKDMKDQNQEGAIFDKPPFNLRTNFRSLNGEKSVSGYFGIVNEQATRWYFSIKDLSYFVDNPLRADCLINYGPPGPAPECLDCREYSNGIATNVKPVWWIN